MVITGATGEIGKALMERFSGTAYDPRKEKFPPKCNILINCIGTNYDSTLKEADMNEWGKVVDTNLTYVVDVIRMVLPSMRERKYGRIINLSSMLSTWTVFGTSAYTASKAGLNAAIRVIAKEEMKHGILINNLNLGYMNLGMTYQIPNWRELKKQCPLGFIEITEVVKAIQFLVQCNYTTGTSIDINGW